MKIIKYVILIFLGIASVSTTTLAQASALNEIISAYETHEASLLKANKVSWPQNDPASLLSENQIYTDLHKRLSSISVESLDKQSQIDYELLDLILEDKIYLHNYGSHLFPLTAEGGFIIGMLYSARGATIKNEKEGQQYLSKLKDLKRYIDQQISWMREGLDQTKVMPKLVVNNCLQVLRNAVSDDAAFLLKPIVETQLSDATKKEAAALRTTELIPWLKKLETFLKDEYLPKTYEQVGISNNTDGHSFYEQRVRYYTTLDMTPQEIYDVGLSEVARIRKEMDAIITELKYDGDFASFITFLREDPQFYAKTPQELLSHAAWLSMKAQEILPKYSTVLPRLPFTVTPVPDEIAPTYTTGRYSGGSMSSGRSGQYWVNTYNLPA